MKSWLEHGVGLPRLIAEFALPEHKDATRNEFALPVGVDHRPSVGTR